MKNFILKSKTGLVLNLIKSEFERGFMLLALLFILGVGQMWGGKGFWSDNAWNMQYYTSGGSNSWLPSEQNMGATYDLGIMTNFYLKGCWVKTWSNDNWTTKQVRLYYWIDGGDAGGNYLLTYGEESNNNRTWTFDNVINYNVITKAGTTAGVHTLKLKWKLDESDSYQSSECSVQYTYPGFTTTSTSQTFDNTTVSSNSSKTISFGRHYGTALTTSRCALSGTNSSEFEVTSINETSVTVKFKPTSNGNKSATLTITDAHSKTCTITLSGKTQRVVTYNRGSYGTGSEQTANKVYGTALTLADKGHFTRTGHTQTAWNTNAAGTGGTSYALKGSYTTESAITLYPTWTPTTYTLTLNKNGGSANGSVKVTYNSSTTSNFTAVTRTGYNCSGYWTATSGGYKIINSDGTLVSYTASVASYINSSGNWINTSSPSLNAQWTAKTTTISFSQNGTGYGSGGQSTTKTATYDSPMPTTISVPTAANGYAFMGYYDQITPSLGTQYYTSTGASARTWDKDVAECTLYAYFKNAEVSIAVDESVFGPVAAGGESWVTATPTVAPTPVGSTNICWALLYDDENPVPAGHDPVVVSGDIVRFNLAGLAPGNYKIRAILRTGSTKCSGTLLHTCDKTITIATDFKVTVRYMCGDENIQDPIVVDGHATSWTDIDAPDIMGYAFSTWDLGDGGITKHPDDALTKQTGFRFKATYSGTLTAIYTKKKYIYLDCSQTFGSSTWTTPYCYIYNSSSSWDNDKGTGATGTMHCIAKGAMTNIDGTDIWYFDYSGYTSTFANKVAFTNVDKRTQEYFYDCQAIYRTDFSDGTPLFIPAVGQNEESKNGNQGHYYNRGYWTNYVGAKTGYTLLIYNSSDVKIKEIPFTSVSNDMRMTMKATVDLEAATTYKVEVLRDNGHYYKNNSDRNYDNSQKNWEYREDLAKGNLVTNAAGDYVFTLSYTDYDNDKDFQIRMKVDYPADANDFQVLYYDNAKWSFNTAHASGWRHPSRMIQAREGGVDTISFFVAKGNSPRLYARKVTNASSMTWTSINVEGASYKSLSVDSSAVYNFKVTQGAKGVISSIENIGAYTGDYYIRCDAMRSKWDNYTTDHDHIMTYTSFSESEANAFGDKFSHYKAKWCKFGKNVKFVIANDYSPCISDTLIQDVGNPYNNINADGFLLDDGNPVETENIYSANIRFMWNRKTNKISRAYVASATNKKRLFLVLRANDDILGEDEEPISEEEINGVATGAPSVILRDDQNWLYEEILYIKPCTRFKLYACYAQTNANPNGAQYFRGTYNGNAFSGPDCEDSNNSVVLISGSGDYQRARVLYDFKTNRLICAWLPTPGKDVTGIMDINADVMVIREHQEGAQYISFGNASSKLTGVKTAYAVMKFNRWALNNRKNTGDHGPLDVGDQKSIYERSLYFISFPFDVRISEVFGFGRYWDEWYIEYYDGLTRAKNGYWIDSPPNWKYVTPEMATNYVLRANEGYLLGLDLDYMKYDNEEFWPYGIETVELFFPSTVDLETLQQTTYTTPALSSDYKCTIDRPGEDGDRRVKDSYWRCLGVPSLNIYNTAVRDGEGNVITWKNSYTWQEDESEFPFIYMWNKSDNTLTPQSTSRFTFLPTHSYLVQNGGEIHWTNVSKSPSSIVAHRQRKESVVDYNWRLQLGQDTTMMDQTYIRMSNIEQVTDTFDFGQDLNKEFNKTRSNIYSYIGYERVGANSMPLKTETTTVVPIGLNIISNGAYTLSMPDGTFGVGVTLVDNLTGIHTNLSAGMEYTCELESGDYTDRFWLEISPVQSILTDIEAVSDDTDNEYGRKVLIDGALYIVRDGKMYDARGARIK